MRRADRLFRIVQLVRGRRLSTARFLAGRLEVSQRTVYRDIADLVAQGVPIEGEAGVGYRMAAGYDLPPLMFSEREAQALVAAARIASSRVDDALAQDMEAAMAKILAVLPSASRAAAERLALYAPPRRIDAATGERLRQLRGATEQRRVVTFGYEDLRGAASTRRVRPLACVYWGEAWTLAAWCETREAFRNFRIDRIVVLEALDTRFRDEPGKTITDLLRAVGPGVDSRP